MKLTYMREEFSDLDKLIDKLEEYDPIMAPKIRDEIISTYLKIMNNEMDIHTELALVASELNELNRTLNYEQLRVRIE